MSTLAAATYYSGLGNVGDVDQMGMGIGGYMVHWSTPASASYATGGDTWTPPAGIPGNWKLMGLLVLPNNLTYDFRWDGGLTTPKIAAFTATLGTQVTAATDLSAQTIQGIAFYQE